MRLLSGCFLMALAACAAPGAQRPGELPAPVVKTAPATIGERADTVILTGERGFAAAELVYITAAAGVGKLADDGLLPATFADQARGWNAEARRWLVRGHAATDAAEKARAATALFGLADKLNALKGK